MAEQESNITRWHMECSGEVQFVGFRYTARLLAKKLGLSGWVMNLPDGRVALEAQGTVSTLRKLLLQLKSQPHIHITHVAITELPTDPDERRFTVKDSLY